jgi:hypothetical protein
MRHVLRATAIAVLAGLIGTPSQAAYSDLSVYGAGVSADGVSCVFEDGGPVISLPWQNVWLGHFSGGRYTRTTEASFLDWKNENVCFPSRASCNRWISANRRAFHQPEGYWTCLPIR